MAAVDIVGMFETIAETGHAPLKGCSSFGVGYDDAFERLRSLYLIDRFGRGGSAEKFVIGPFGSGKTHFLRQLLEISREEGCVTSEVQLGKDIDFTQSLMVYREIVRQLQPPGGDDHGIRALLLAAIAKVKQIAPDDSQKGALAGAWVAGVDKVDFKLESFGRVLQIALDAQLRGDDETFGTGCRWLSGEFGDRDLARELGVARVVKAEESLYGRRSLLSLFQFIKAATFQGTVVGLDEAEQGLSVDRRKMQLILSMLQSGINALVDLEHGAALVVYALTPDIVERIEEFPALQQRVADPRVGRGFFDGETLAPKIDLSRRLEGPPEDQLGAIGDRLANLIYSLDESDRLIHPKEEVLKTIAGIARDVARQDVRSGNRRTMVKRTCAMLLDLYRNGRLEDPGNTPATAEQGEV